MDDDIYTSSEYKQRMDRAKRSLTALVNVHKLSVDAVITDAAESIAYWQMRATMAEGLNTPRTNRHD